MILCSLLFSPNPLHCRCSSYIGRRTGQQEISIGQGCDKKGIVAHEILHALGRWHEQARADRNDYITINTENIKKGRTILWPVIGGIVVTNTVKISFPGFEVNFEIISGLFATTNGVPYDYDSVMHYPSDAFSANGEPTILPVNSDIDVGRLGQRNGLSVNDIAHIRALYCRGQFVTSTKYACFF